MHLEKKIIANLPEVYTIAFFYLGKNAFIGAGSEGEHPLYLIRMDDPSSTTVVDGPGGTMSLVPVPGKEDTMVSVMGLFPPFISREAGVMLHSLTSGQWHTKKIFDIPFAHRCEVFNYKDVNYLFIASASKFKKNPEDWSLPGELHIVPLEELVRGNSQSDPFIDDITRNHGMLKTVIEGTEAICISGAEGIVAITPDEDSKWISKKLFDNEVSEFAFLDMDSDGVDELVTIEPFHGNTLNFYKRTTSGWDRFYQAELSFGHGLSAGILNKTPSVVVGSRRGDKALNLFRVNSLKVDDILHSVIEADTGPTQTKIFNYNSRDYILSSNQAKNEVVLYYA
jgi:hypothetical protein